jgi:hypothetical protein
MTRIVLLAVVLVGLTAGLAQAQSVGINDQEIQGFFLPGTNTKAFRVHASRTAMGLILAHGDIVAVGGYKVPFTFAHGGRTQVSLSNVAVPVAGTAGASAGSGTGVLYQPAATRGSIIAIAIASSTALTAGTGTCEATVLEQAGGAGTLRTTGFTVALDAGTGYTRYRATTQARGLTTFTNGDAIGANLSTSSAFAPTSAELACTIIVEL